MNILIKRFFNLVLITFLLFSSIINVRAEDDSNEVNDEETSINYDLENEEDYSEQINEVYEEESLDYATTEEVVEEINENVDITTIDDEINEINLENVDLVEELQASDEVQLYSDPNASHNDGITDKSKWKAPLTDEEFESCTGAELQLILDNWFEEKRIILSAIEDEFERAEEITRIVAEEFDYNPYYQGSADMVLHGGGDCWASTNLIGSLCKRNGLECYGRTAVNDGGAGSGHANIVIKIDGEYYIAEAGFVGRKPRGYWIEVSPYGLSLEKDYNSDIGAYEYTVYQYDGDKKTIDIPATINGITVTTIGLRSQETSNRSVFAYGYTGNVTNYVNIPATVTKIIESAFMGTPYLKGINVAQDNPNYKSIDGALYSKDGKTLYAVPSDGKTYQYIGSQVESLGKFAFINCDELKEVYIDRMVAPEYNGNSSKDLMWNSNVTIIVPAGATGYDAFPWNQFRVIHDGDVTSASINETNMIVSIGDKKDIEINVLPNDVPFSIKFVSSNPDVVSIDEYGRLDFKKVGNATITTEVYKKSYSSMGVIESKINLNIDKCNIKVTPAVDSIRFKSDHIILDIDETVYAEVEILPSDAANKRVTWYTYNDDIFEVDEETGLITPKAQGSSYVYAYSDNNNRSTNTYVEVIKKMKSITLNRKTINTKNINSTYTLIATTTPSDSTYKGVTWESSNPDVASVSYDGVVTINNPGSATITATTQDTSNLSAKCEVTVTPALNTPEITYIRNTLDGVYFTFDKIDGASYYLIYRKDNKNNNDYQPYSYTSNTVFNDSFVEAGVTYYYQVRAFGEKGSSALSKFRKICYLSAPELTSITNTSKGVRLDYTKVEGSKWYRVYRRASNESEWTKMGQTTKLYYVDKEVESGVTYYYLVRSIRGNYYSGVINSKYDKINYLATPELKTIEKVSNGIKLSYSKTNGASKYYIYRKDNKNNKSYTKIAETTDLTFTDTTAEKGVTYTYLIKARRGSYTSYKSNAKKLDYK